MTKKGRNNMPSSVADILSKFNPLEDKYISREFQSYGIYLAEQLSDMRHRSLYMKLSKEIPRPVLEKALSFVKDAGKVRSKARLFMWKLSNLMNWGKKRHKSLSTKGTESKKR